MAKVKSIRAVVDSVPGDVHFKLILECGHEFQWPKSELVIEDLFKEHECDTYKCDGKSAEASQRKG